MPVIPLFLAGYTPSAVSMQRTHGSFFSPLYEAEDSKDSIAAADGVRLQEEKEKEINRKDVILKDDGG